MGGGSSSSYVPVCSRAELAPGALRSVEVAGRAVLLADLGGVVFAADDTCTHSGGQLSEGALIDGAVQCPWHGARFDVRTGESVGPLACPRLRTHAARERDGRIEVELDG